MAKRVQQTGDYIMNEQPNGDGAGGGKMLVNLGDHRKAWIRKVTGLVSDGDMTEVLKCIVDQAMAEDENPESYAVRVEKWRLQTRLDDIERREKALQEEKQRLVSSLESDSKRLAAS